jgi:hypothetical protein
MFQNFNLDDPKTQGLLAAAAQMFQASGPSRMPQSLGGIFGQALTAGMGGYQGAKQQAFDQQVSEMKRKKMEEDISMESLKNQILRADTERQTAGMDRVRAAFADNPNYQLTQIDRLDIDPNSAIKNIVEMNKPERWYNPTAVSDPVSGGIKYVSFSSHGNQKEMNQFGVEKSQFIAPTESTPGAFANPVRNTISPVKFAGQQGQNIAQVPSLAGAPMIGGAQLPPVPPRTSGQVDTSASSVPPPMADAGAGMDVPTAPSGVGVFGQVITKPKNSQAPSGWRYTTDGSLEAIPGGPADLKAQNLANQKSIGSTDVDAAISSLRDAYNRLEEGGGITSTKNSNLGNIAASSASSGVGQALGKAFGTSNQSARNEIAMTRPALLSALMKATGMSAKQMDSNAELKLWLSTATDPQLDVQANRKALDNIERKYLSKINNGPSTPAAPSNLVPTLPTANASNKGKRIRDTQTGKILKSNGMQWVEE